MAKEKFDINTLSERLKTNKTWWRVAFWLPLVIGIPVLAAGASVALFLFTALIAPWIVGVAAGVGALVLVVASLYTWGGHQRFVVKAFSDADGIDGGKLWDFLLQSGELNDLPDSGNYSRKKRVVHPRTAEDKRYDQVREAFLDQPILIYEALAHKINALYEQFDTAAYSPSHKADILVALVYQLHHHPDGSSSYQAIGRALKDLEADQFATEDELFEKLCEILGLQLNQNPGVGNEKASANNIPEGAGGSPHATNQQDTQSESQDDSRQQYSKKNKNEVDMEKMYKKLGLIRGQVTERAVKKAYYKLALKTHPDKQRPEDRKSAAEKFKAIQEAYQNIIEGDKAMLDSASPLPASDLSSAAQHGQTERTQSGDAKSNTGSIFSWIFGKRGASEDQDTEEKQGENKARVAIGMEN